MHSIFYLQNYSQNTKYVPTLCFVCSPHTSMCDQKLPCAPHIYSCASNIGRVPHTVRCRVPPNLLCAPHFVVFPSPTFSHFFFSNVFLDHIQQKNDLHCQKNDLHCQKMISTSLFVCRLCGIGLIFQMRSCEQTMFHYLRHVSLD